MSAERHTRCFVKICGICSADDAAAVAALKPDAMGFVFWGGSKRGVKPADVAKWTANLPREILKVGVFVDSPADVIRDVAEAAALDVIQLHGFQSLENPDAFFPIIGKTGREIWGVVHIGRDGSPVGTGGFVDAYLVDSYSDNLPGGTGKTCDWSAARDFVKRSPKRVLLAGGLTPDNVGRAIADVRPWGVDVSSGVERKPRVKDLGKVRKFIESCRS